MEGGPHPVAGGAPPVGQSSDRVRADREKPSHLRVLGAALAASATGILPAFLVGALAAEMRGDLGFGPAVLGVVVSAFFLTAGVASVVLGRRAGRWGWQSSIRIAACGTLATLLLVAVAVQSWQALLVVMIFGGIWHALVQPASNLAVARGAWRHRQGLSFGIRQAAIPATMMFAGLSVPVVALTLGWRWAFVTAAVFPLTAFALVPRTGPADRGREPTGRPTSDNQRMVSISVAGGFAAAAAGALSAFFVLSAVESGIDASAAGKLLAVASVVGLSVRVVAGWAVDRFSFGGFAAVVRLLLLGSVGYLVLAFGGPAYAVLGSVVAFGAGWGWPGLFHFGIVDSNPGNPASASGIAQAGLSTGAAVGPLGFGVVVEHASFSVAWVGTAGISLLAAALVTYYLHRSQ